METKRSFFTTYSEIKQKKEYVNEILVGLRNEIKEKEKELYRLKNLNYCNEIKKLEENKKFLIEYPNYLRNFKIIGLKQLLKNTLNTIASIFMIAFFIALFVMFKIGFSVEGLIVSLGVSSLIVLYNIFGAPFVDNYIRKKYILEKYENIENIDLKIDKTLNKQREIEKNINDIEESIKIKRNKEESLINYYDRLDSLEAELFFQIESAANDIWNDLARDYYIYEDSSSLKLTNKKNRF